MEKLIVAIQFIKQGNKKAAVPILAGIIQADPDNESAWLWLSACVENEGQKKDCLRQALRINPENMKVREALDAMEGKESRFAQITKPRPPWGMADKPEPRIEKSATPAEEHIKEGGKPPEAAMEDTQPIVRSTVQNPVPEASMGKNEEKVITVHYKFTKPDKKQIRQIITGELQNGWTYVGYTHTIGEKALSGFNPIYTTIKGITGKTPLFFARNPAVTGRQKHIYPLGFRVYTSKKITLDPRGRVNKQRHFQVINYAGDEVGFINRITDKKNTGLSVIDNLYSDPGCTHRLAERQEKNIFTFSGMTPQLFARAGGDSGNEDLLTRVDGSKFMWIVGTSPHSISYEILNGVVTVIGDEVYRLGGLARLSDEEEKAILLWSFGCWWDKVYRMCIEAEMRGWDAVPYINAKAMMGDYLPLPKINTGS